MRRVLTTVASLALITSVPGLVSAALAHGGSYRGPFGDVPPDSREPSDPPPPPEGGGPTTPGGETGGGPTTGGPDGGGPSTPGGGSGGPSTGGGGGGPPTGGGGGGGGGPSTGAGRPKAQGKGAGYEDWTFWWNYNKDEILQLKSAVKRMQRGPTTGSAGAFTRKASSGKAIQTATDTAIQEQIVPVLREFLNAKDISFHIQSAAELGLAKIGDETIIDTLKKMAINEGKVFPREVQESAGLGFGLLQKDTQDIRTFLIELVKDESKDTFVRPFSAISLGLLIEKNGADRDQAAMTALIEVASKKASGADVRPACITALGLLGNDAAVPFLLEALRTTKFSKGTEPLDATELAYVVSALGRIGRAGLDKAGEETAVVDEMIKIVEKDKAKHEVNERRSVAIALGQIGPLSDAKVQKKLVDTLEKLAESAEDTQEKNFSIMALGRMGAAKGVEATTRTAIVKILGKQLKDGKGITPPFAALALGLVGRAYSEEGLAAPEEEIRAPIRAKFAETGGDPKSRGAYAVASGLVKDVLATEKLKEALKDKGVDKRVRGYCALALGMIGASEALDVIKTTLKDDADRDLRVQTAMAAGLMADASVIQDIIGILEDKDASNYELGSAALALGQIGDETAIKALVTIAKDETKAYPDLTRALATVALGQIGDRRDVPTLARVATDVNYRARVPFMTELLDIL